MEVRVGNFYFKTYENLNLNIEKVNTETKVAYPLIEPFAYANIYWRKDINSFFYEVKEVELTQEEKEVFEYALVEIQDLISETYESLENLQERIAYLIDNFNTFLSVYQIIIPESSYNKILYYLYKELVGLGKIEPIMQDPFIEDVSCDGYKLPIYLLHKKFNTIPSNLSFEENELEKFIEKLAQRSGRYVSYSKPILDATLPDGSRVNATYSKDITTRGPTFTIRKFSFIPLSPLDLIKNKTANEYFLALLWIAVQFKRNILIIGETASGKTTLLNAISLFIPKTSKIVSIEDTREINLPFENWIPAVSRTGVGINKIGEITLFDLLKASLRQNPDYIIVGEVRGEEANVLFQGMASGHCSFATFHANNVNSVISRLTTPPINLPSSLISLLDLVILTAHYPNKGRKIKEIEEIYSTKEKLINQNVIGKYNPLQDQFFMNQTINLFKKIEDFYGISVEELWNELKIRAKLLKTLSNLNIDWKTFSDIVNLYYIDKEKVLNMFLKAY